MARRGVEEQREVVERWMGHAPGWSLVSRKIVDHH
jgi:hypothetical protein